MSCEPTNPPPSTLPGSPFGLVLVHPQIAPNTGNVARLCVATGTPLDIVRPMGFVLSDKQLRRSAMDYWPRLRLTVHDDLDAFLTANTAPLWLFDSIGTRSLWTTVFAPGDRLVFGSETLGLPDWLLQKHADRVVRIPQVAGERCLNLSTSAGVVLYEALRQVSCPGATQSSQ